MMTWLYYFESIGGIIDNSPSFGIKKSECDKKIFSALGIGLILEIKLKRSASVYYNIGNRFDSQNRACLI